MIDIYNKRYISKTLAKANRQHFFNALSVHPTKLIPECRFLRLFFGQAKKGPPLHAVPFMPQVFLGIREHLLPDTNKIVFMGEKGIHDIRGKVRS